MKILLLHDIQQDKQNGVSVSLGILARELSKTDNEIRILTLSDDHKSYKQDNNYYLSSVPALVYPDIRMRPPIHTPFLDEIVAWEPDVIHTNCEFSTFLIAEQIKKHCKEAPVWVHTFHTDYQYYIGFFQKFSAIRNGFVPMVLNRCFSKCSAVIVPTQKMEHYVRSSKFSPDLDIRIIPTGIDFSELEQEKSTDLVKFKQDLGLPQDSKVLLFLGRISAEKNLAELVECFADYVKTHDKIYLVTVGNGPYKDTLIKLTEKLGIAERCIIHDGVPHTEIRKFYDLADVFASASISETQGLTFYEALYCGVPVLAKDKDCLEDSVTEGENGAFFSDKTDFAKALDSILALKKTNSHISVLPKCFESHHFALSVESLYKELLDKRDQQN